jgi:branched-chain amino acid transport system ATP-binding protein
VFALLGPNGAGKTSTIMAIMGHVDIHGGRILLENDDITSRRAIDRVGLGISIVPEGRQLFSDLTVDENLTVGGYARPIGRDAAKRDRVFNIFPRLHDRARADGRAATIAGGRTLARPDAEDGRPLP